jgi:hypothetical protein
MGSATRCSRSVSPSSPTPVSSLAQSPKDRRSPSLTPSPQPAAPSSPPSSRSPVGQGSTFRNRSDIDSANSPRPGRPKQRCAPSVAVLVLVDEPHERGRGRSVVGPDPGVHQAFRQWATDYVIRLSGRALMRRRLPPGSRSRGTGRGCAARARHRRVMSAASSQTALRRYLVSVIRTYTSRRSTRAPPSPPVLRRRLPRRSGRRSAPVDRADARNPSARRRRRRRHRPAGSRAPEITGNGPDAAFCRVQQP